MARKSLIEDIFDEGTKVPWWIGVIIAVCVWIAGLIVGAIEPKTSPKAVFYTLGRYFLNFLACVVLAAAAVSAIKQLFRRKLLDRQDNLSSLRSLSWREFEQLVGEAYRRQGYDVEETGGGGADGGIDLVLRGHGETVLVQCKQWRVLQVGVDKVRELFGVLHAQGATRGFLVTTGTFTNEARSFSAGKPLMLVDGPALAIFVHQVRTSPQPATSTFHPPPSTDPTAPPSDRPPASPATCPQCGAPMVLRTAKRGANAGNNFYGCTRYPACKGIRNA